MMTMGKIAAKLQLTRWLFEEKATALTESVILFPVMISLLMGCYDLGQGISVNQKTIGASQIIADLTARYRSVDMDMMNDIIRAGELAVEPYSTLPFGYDIVSVQFDEDGQPEVLWRITQNMDENDDAVQSTQGLGEEGDGVIVVTTSYNFTPYFTNFVVDEINMNEVAFLHGRRSSTVTCADCPSGG
jgi:Flp pilus assembly protein TadG